MAASSHPGINGHCQECSAIKFANFQAAIAASEETPTSSKRWGLICLRTLLVALPIAIATDRVIEAREGRPTSSQRPRCLRTLPVTRPIALAANREMEPRKERP